MDRMLIPQILIIPEMGVQTFLGRSRLPAGRAIHSYCTGLSHIAGIRCYPYRECLNSNSMEFNEWAEFSDDRHSKNS